LTSSYVYNKLAINSAFAGHTDGISLTFFNRSQWINLKGAPQYNNISANFGRRESSNGIGVNLQRISFGVTNISDFSISYAYKISINESWRLSFGLAPSISNGIDNFLSSNLQATDGIANDASIPKDNLMSIFFNLGTGVYASSDQAFVGYSSSSLFSKIALTGQDYKIPLDRVHSLMAGVNFKINDIVKILAQSFARLGDNNYSSLDLNLISSLNDQFYLGSGIRVGKPFTNSAIFQLGFALKKGYLGFSYDFPMSALLFSQGGNVEFIGIYNIEKDKKQRYEGISPRFF
jgi:type IX secretion system PorP/SprF family membrane protein